MKFLIQTILTLVICYLLQLFLPWWSIAIGALGVAYFIDTRGFVSFCSGFVGVGLLWFVMAFYIDATTQSILTEKINKLLPLNAFVMTTLIGGLVGGMAALTGTQLKSRA